MLSEFYDLFGTNEKLFVLINAYTNVSILPYFLQIISGIFKIWNFAVAYCLYCTYIIIKLRKENSNQENFNFIFDKMFRIGTIYAFFGLAYAAIKFGINMPRPYCSLPSNSFTTVANFTDERCLSSFPSAHTALALLVAYFAWPHIKPLYKLLATVIVTLVAISRITLAMHYPADILYSVVIAIIIILAGNVFCKILQTGFFKYIKNFVYKTLIKSN